MRTIATVNPLETQRAVEVDEQIAFILILNDAARPLGNHNTRFVAVAGPDVLKDDKLIGSGELYRRYAASGHHGPNPGPSLVQLRRLQSHLRRLRRGS